MLCTAEHCSLRSRKPKLYGDSKTRYPKITAAMEKLLHFWVDKSHKRLTSSTGVRANWINCLLYIWKVLLNLHNFPLLNIKCTEPYLGPLYRSYIIVQISNCKIPERVPLNGAIWKRFSNVSRQWRCAACHLLQVFTSLRMMKSSLNLKNAFTLCIVAKNAFHKTIFSTKSEIFRTN